MTPTPATTISSLRVCRICRLLVLAVFVITLGCASVHPPVEAPTTDDAPRLTPLRADSEGLEFILDVPEASPGDEIEIWRRDDEWMRLRTISVDEPLAEALRSGDARWRDDLDEQTRNLDYRLRLSTRDINAYSPVVEIDWQGWLSPPQPTLEIRPSISSTVLIHWPDDTRLEARILRRDVLADTEFQPLAIVDPAADNRYRDDSVEPGGVYTYRIQFVDRLASVPRFSPFVESDYISIPGSNDGSETGNRNDSG